MRGEVVELLITVYHVGGGVDCKCGLRVGTKQQRNRSLTGPFREQYHSFLIFAHVFPCERVR